MGTWGVKGHVKVKRFGSSSGIFNSGSTIFHNDGDLIIQNARSTRSKNNDILVIKFESIDSIEKAEALKGLDLKKRKKLKEMGINIGLLFQTVDDLIDYSGDSLTVGKPTKRDKKKGKPH